MSDVRDKEEGWVRIPGSLYNAIKERLSELGVGSVEEFVIQVVREAVEELTRKGVEISEEERQAIEKRLRELGYL
mgnify:CR=1 FL=1